MRRPDAMENPGRSEGASAWPDAALEAFHDGAMGDDDAAALGAALREDPGLRARLAGITRADARMAEALLTAGGERGVSRRVRWRAAGVLCAAAGVVLAGVAVAVVWGRAGGSGGSGAAPHGPVLTQSTGAGTGGTDPGGAEIAHDPEPEPPAYNAARVLAVITLSGPKAREEHAGEEAESRPDAEQVTLATGNRPAEVVAGADGVRVPARLTSALARGDVSAAAAAIGRAGPGERADAYRALGELLRSAASAEALLDALPPEDQLAACRLWADDPRLRPIVFPRLRVLAANTRLASEHSTVLSELWEREELRAWLRSYGLASGSAPPPRRG